MKTWEIDVEMRVRKTLVIEGPATEDAARDIARMMLMMMLMEPENAGLSAFLKWSDGRRAYRPMPVETIIDTVPEIVALREIKEP